MKNKPYLKTRFCYFLYSIVLVSFAACGAQPALSRWISGGSAAPEKAAPMLMKEFMLDAKPEKAVFTVAVAGWCEVSVNGEKVGRDVLSPVTCQPDRRTSSLALDVTSLLRKGANTLEVLLGNGWQNTFTIDAWGFANAPWIGAPKICGELVCDGRMLFVTDGTWRAYDSPIIFNALRNGEWYDARREGRRINERAATVEKYAPWGIVSPEDATPCRVFEALEPKGVVKMTYGPDIHVYDFGANISGWCEIEVEGEAGAVVKLDYDESVNSRGSLLGHIKQHITGRGEKRPVQHDEYTLAGRKGGEKWHPRFTYHGFRYVQVDIRGKARLKSIKARFVHSAFERAGTVKTSYATFAALQDATERSFLSNFVGIPTDCPHREKNGWTGDAQLAMETGLWNFEAKASYIHFLRMMLDAQRLNGAVPCIIPCTPKFGFGWGSGPAWDALLFEIPWQIYRFYGDDAPAREAYGAMKRYLSYMSAQADKDGLYDYGLGDWCNWYKDAPGTPVRFTDSAYVYQFNRRLAFWAERFGEKDFAAKCLAAANRIKAAFNKAFYKGDGLYGEGNLTELAAPLYFEGLCADGEEAKVAKRLVEAVRAKRHRSHFGILGAKWVPRVLAERGYADDAFRMFVQPDMPGWAYWLKSGHGTLHEAWDSVSSLNHIMFGDLSAWAYEYAAGIVPIEPGFKKIAFRPHVLEGVDSFIATYKTSFGEIRAGWRRVGGKVEFVCEVPSGVEIEGRSSDPSKGAYRNPSLPTDVRVKDLLSRMTLAEKCAQLGKLRGFNTYDRTENGIVLHPDVMAGLATNCPGTIYGILRADWWSGQNWKTGVKPEMAVDSFNAYQRIAMERTRLGIPIFFVEEAPHGLMALGEPVYPTGLGLGSTFDADLMRRIGRQIGRARLRGVHCVYAPILDIARDPRWSRCEECFGEDPELVSVLGFAEFEGLRECGIEPCLKHYVGGGLAEGGHNTASAHFGLTELYNVQLRPFRRCISAGARHLMSTYHDVDGEPCTASRFLLTDILRGQLGFDGFVTADGGAIHLLHGRGIAASMPQAAAMALKAGCDGESGSKTVTECGSVMRSAFDAGLVSMDDIDLAASRILKLKFDMGLFENPYVKGNAPDRAAEKALALEAAQKSLVLLENRDALPLERSLSVAVIGPNADHKIMNQLGDYTAPQRRADVVTVLDGVKAFASRVAYAKGCGIRSKRRDGFAEAERIASEADVTVLVLGGSSSPYAGVTQSDALGGATVVTGKEDDENDKDSGEGTDRSTLGYSGVQEDLFRAVRAKAKKLIVVLIQGRPLVVDEIAAKADAVLLAWYPGAMGGQAVAETLYGVVNPSGRLPVSIPHSVGQLPVHSGGYAANRLRYIDGPGDAAYPFGYGLSYTVFAYSGLKVSAAEEASVSVTNTGSRDGDEIVRLYFSVKGSGRQRPHRELLAFRRVSLKAGETRRVTLPFDRRLFGEYGRDGVYEPPRGEVSIWVDGCKDRVALHSDR